MPKKRKMYDFCKKRMSKPHLFPQRISTRTVIPTTARKNTKHYIEQGQDATLRGAKEDPNTKEPKYLTEDGNQGVLARLHSHQNQGAVSRSNQQAYAGSLIQGCFARK
jgi:hypothetical protein